MSSAIVNQPGWRWCSKCSGLAYFGIALCPNGGVHDHSDSGDYTIRNNNSAGGQGQWRYCKNCQTMSWTGYGNGLCPNGQAHNTVTSFDYHLTIDQDNTEGQHGWRYCSKCEGLVYTAGAVPGTCAGGGVHSTYGSGNYTLSLDGTPVSSGQSKWKHCKKCQGIAYDGESACSGGGQHINVGSGDYSLEYTLADNIASTKGQNNWKYCNKCEALTYAGGSTKGACPAGSSHEHGGSGNYVVANKPLENAQDGWSYCNKCQAFWYSANGPAKCPQGLNSFHDSTGSFSYSIANAGALLPSIGDLSSSNSRTQSPSIKTIPTATGEIPSPTDSGLPGQSGTPGQNGLPGESVLPTNKSSSLSIGAMAGIIIGAIGLLLLALAAFFFLRRRQRKTKSEYLVTPLPKNNETPEHRSEMASNEDPKNRSEMPVPQSGWEGFLKEAPPVEADGFSQR